jgi:manganese/zinc/iron transport system permease protein
MDAFFQFDAIALWIIAVCAMVNIACGILGCFMVLRRTSMLGDAISHAILPGLAVAFIVTNSRHAVPMFVGAMIAGTITALLTHFTHRFAKVPEDASMGVVFTSLFALGIVLIEGFVRNVDIDANCVLYGILESAAIDTIDIAGMEIPRIFPNLVVALGAVLLFTSLFWKELKVASFDPGLATTLGYNANLIHYLLMALVAGVTVAAFEAVGSILVVAMLIAPAATAYLLTDRLSTMVILASIIGVLCAWLGRSSAAALQTSAAGMMSFVAFALFLLAVLFSPKHGYLGKKLHQARTALRIVCEDALAMLYRLEELHVPRRMKQQEVHEALDGGFFPRLALWQLMRSQSIQRDGEHLVLTASGRDRARKLVTGHRLWESYLHEHLGTPLDHLHGPAERMEHYLNEELQQTLATQIKDSSTDPHGRPILPPDTKMK